MTGALAVYIHWPFCVSKCPYCDFNSRATDAVDHAAWAEAYAREIGHYARLLPGRRITSIYFGGGTPSLMSSRTVETVLQKIAASWTLASDAEITLEANPSSSDEEKFTAFRAAGINRLSLGAQALSDEALTFLGRVHSAAEAHRAIELAARLFPRFSFDLIYARAGQTLTSWQEELRKALSFGARHISLYQLTIEPGTKFFARAQKGEALTADEDVAADMYELTQDEMSQAGLPAYEISNHASAGHESRHNLTYWRYEDYIGIGPGAHGRCVTESGRVATENHRAPDDWLSAVAQHNTGQRQCEKLDTPAAMREALLMGLRLAQGIDATAWQKKFGALLSAFLPEDKSKRLQKEGLLVMDSQGVRATAAGRQKLNAVLTYLAG